MPMSRSRNVVVVLSLLIVFVSGSGQAPPAAPPGPIGFAPASRGAFAKAEAAALAVPTPDRARSWLRTLTEDPHPAGSPADYKTALFVRDRLAEWGWKAEIAEYEVLLNAPTPRAHRDGRKTPFLKLVAPEEKDLPVIEAPHAADKDSADPAAFPAFHGYGVSGDATGQVVYANYGTPEDFAALDRLGVDVKDRIVLVRYGNLFRGLKVRNAQKRGAKGVLIYSDPADDGYARGDVYPNGPFRPGTAVQRGSVQFLSLGPGDPSTPDGPSVKGAKRLPWDIEHGFTLSPTRIERGPETVPSVAEWEKATGLKRDDYFATIPSLPIGYDAARPILEALGGPNVPPGWQGGLPLAYHVGPGTAVVRFAIDVEYRLETIWNVIATLRGGVEPDRWVMLSNHRDAWVYGAVDPGSGTAATLETCRALGAAVKAGWTPRRSIVYASWDAEEYGLVGSTEWADEHAKRLDDSAVLLLNVDSAVSGPELDLDGVPSLRDLLLDACGAVNDPRNGRSLREIWMDRKRSSWAANAPVESYDPLWTAVGGGPPVAADGRPAGTVAQPSATAARFSPQLNALGSGSDYTAFLDHLGVPALDVGFGGRYGVYHSVYDDFYWMEEFGDPEFQTHATAARLYTAFLMRAAGAEVLPLKFRAYGEALRDHLDDLRRMLLRKARAAAPGARPMLEVDQLDPLAKGIVAFQREAAELDRATEELSGRDGTDPARLAAVNDALHRVERAFLLEGGLPGRAWFRHAVYAPGLTTGYASWPFPGVRQAVVEGDAKLLASQSAALAGRIDGATAALKAATAAARAAVAQPTR